MLCDFKSVVFMKKLYRYQIQYFVEEIEGSDTGIFAVEMVLREIKIVKETAHTYIIEQIYGKKQKRIYKKARNSYAHETKEDALRCFFHRTRKHASIMANKSKILKELLEKLLSENKETLFNGSSFL